VDDPDTTGPAPAHPDPTGSGPPRMPGWVKGSVIVGIVLVLVVVLVAALGGGSHGPARHLPAGSGAEIDPATRHTLAAGHG